jgi:hypothetical protein
MTLLYLIKKPQLSQQIARWLLLFPEYDFWVVHKPGHSHFVANIFSSFLNAIENSRVFSQLLMLHYLYSIGMAIGSAYLHFYRKFSKWLFHKATKEIGVEGFALSHH